MKLKVNEIFYSIQGETTTAGLPSLFVRLTGCNLNCVYCDTEYAKIDGNSMEIDKIVEEILQFPEADHVTITGGEPLLYKNSILLIKELVKLGINVQIETNGSIDLADVPVLARKIVDIKLPSSREYGSFLMSNLNYLTEKDELKFVILDKNDYVVAKDFILLNNINSNIVINFSPVFGKMDPLELTDLILNDRLKVRLNFQLHKIVGLLSDVEKEFK